MGDEGGELGLLGNVGKHFFSSSLSSLSILEFHGRGELLRFDFSCRTQNKIKVN